MKLDSTPLIHQETIDRKAVLEITESKTATLTPVNPPIEPEVDYPNRDKTPWGIFATTFVTIFFAEIGDKTQLSTLLMSAESDSPWVVFVGSAMALVSTSLLGVLLGSWIASKLAPRTINKAAGVMLLLISLMLFWDLR